MSSYVLIGASGFLGKALILSSTTDFPIKAIARSLPSDIDLRRDHVSWHRADILEPGSLDLILQVGDVVINLLYIPGENKVDNFSALANICNSCIKCGVSRLLHCSTAVVVGKTDETLVTELTSCNPHSEYELTKYALEEQCLTLTQQALDIAILRPTAIVGPRSRNLVKLALALKNENQLLNNFRASLYGNRPMHLVPVQDVISAIYFLASYHSRLNSDVFIISADDDPDNNFSKVEEVLMSSMNLKTRDRPIWQLPSFFLSFLLWLLGRSEYKMSRHYSSKKLNDLGFRRDSSVSNAVREFSQFIINHTAGESNVP